MGYSSGDPTSRTAPGPSGWITIPHGQAGSCSTTGSASRSPSKIRRLDDRVEQVAGRQLKPCRKSRARDLDRNPDRRNDFLLRLTTVIEADQRIGPNRPGRAAEKRTASPTQFARERSIDGKDHFQYCDDLTDQLSITPTQKDMNGDGSDGTNPLICRDDTGRGPDPR